LPVYLRIKPVLPHPAQISLSTMRSGSVLCTVPHQLSYRSPALPGRGTCGLGEAISAVVSCRGAQRGTAPGIHGAAISAPPSGPPVCQRGRGLADPELSACRRIWIPSLAKYPSTPNASNSHTTQTMFVNRTRPRQSDGIALPSRVPAASRSKGPSTTQSPDPPDGASGRIACFSLVALLRGEGCPTN
jgi:hypothetical protein